ncbi:hypothetical protein EBR21_07635 [bacterium]|nr:hypothetical protein [bacterium]
MFRLDRLERFALFQMYAKLPKHCDSWLFGSRIHPESKGGDIDILVQADLSATEQIELSQKLTLEFQSHCEEKIDVVVCPKTKLTPEQSEFIRAINRTPLDSVVNAPLLDHVAVLVSDLDECRRAIRDWGFFLQAEQNFEVEGTRECYVGESERPSRVLLLQAVKDGPYQRTFQKRGAGLHHLGITVFSLAEFLQKLDGTGWQIHPATPPNGRAEGPVYLFGKKVPLILEVSQRPPLKPSILAPVVQRVRVRISHELLNTISCMNIHELTWSADEETSIMVSGEWKPIRSIAG